MHRITASHIVSWVEANAKEAQISLPRLVRRLCYEIGSTTQIAFPSGDSTYRPGWDGLLQIEHGNAWVPEGKSCWEMGCNKDISKKANSEYSKRTRQIRESERLDTAFIFVSPRRWSQKSSWLKEKRGKHEWSDVRAFDADDLEQWLEQRPDLALQFAEELGLAGWGVESPERYWSSWSQQCKPAITMDAFFVDRIQTQEQLISKIQQPLHQNSSAPLVIRADNEKEAAAFAVACISAEPELINCTLVVTEREGWQYVEANHQLRIVIVARSEIAATPSVRQGLLTIIPRAAGDIDNMSSESVINLPRPNMHDFEKALVSIGVEESDAKRYAQSTGRSWSVFRRVCASNPSIRRPAWMDMPEVAILPVLCFIGAWTDNRDADRLSIQNLAGKPYEEIERDLRVLAQVDDAPVLQIGDVWKAKSPLELLSLTGQLITRNQLDRFFVLVQQILSAPDPQLELPDRERYAAQIQGKVRPNSALLIDSLCDALAKLAVRGPDISSLKVLSIDQRIGRFVHDLLGNADGERWLSLASYLPALAEASPESFLRAIEASLRAREAPVTRLITETSDSGMFGRCWHSGLLWALETLAWSPKNLARVAMILARLCHVHMKGNWGNKPSASLFGLFRTWLPQTSADIHQRISVLDQLIQKEPDIAFDLLENLSSLGVGQQWASPAAHPQWRDDNAGAGNGVPEVEIWQMINAARERLLKCSEGNAMRIAKIIQKAGFQDINELSAVLPLAEYVAKESATDEDREVIREAFRNKLHWHRNYDETPPEILERALKPIESLYRRLAANDLVIRYRWLFSSHWPQLPMRTRDEDYALRGSHLLETRLQALNEIHAALGMDGIERMVRECGNPEIVGGVMAEMAWNEKDREDWIIAHGGSFDSGVPMTRCISGLLHGTSSLQSKSFINTVISEGLTLGWSADICARLLLLARFEPETWKTLDSCDDVAVRIYWSEIKPGYSGPNDKSNLEIVLHHLLEANRPRTALHYCQYALEQTNAHLLFEMLQRYSQGEESQGNFIESWHLGEMLVRLEKSGEIEKMDLVRLEFALFPALAYGQESRAAALYEAITSDASLFCELVCILYKPEHGDREEPNLEATHDAALTVWQVLRHCTRQPGTRPDGSIDHDTFSRFITDVRELCRHADRLDACDQRIGEILAYAPADEDGLWPFAPARMFLDQPEMERMRNGFLTGTRNIRGVTMRGMLDGGAQERNLASNYRKLAIPLHSTQPYMAALLEELAKGYEYDGEREDMEANLRKEGY